MIFISFVVELLCVAFSTPMSHNIVKGSKLTLQHLLGQQLWAIVPSESSQNTSLEAPYKKLIIFN